MNDIDMLLPTASYKTLDKPIFEVVPAEKRYKSESLNIGVRGYINPQELGVLSLKVINKDTGEDWYSTWNLIPGWSNNSNYYYFAFNDNVLYSKRINSDLKSGNKSAAILAAVNPSNDLLPKQGDKIELIFTSAKDGKQKIVFESEY